MTEIVGGRARRLGVAQAAWTLTEAGNEPFFALVQRFVFASYFAAQLFADADAGAETWGFALALAGVALGVLAPVLGAFADAAGPRKPWIAALMTASIVSCAALWFAAPGLPVLPVVIAVIVATVSVELLVVFTNAALPSLAPPERVGALSGLCFGFGQIAGLIALGLILWAADQTDLFGMTDSAHAVDRLAGPIAAAAVLIFLTPFMLIAPDEPVRPLGDRMQAARAGLSTLWRTLREAIANPNMRAFIIGRAIGADGMSILFAFGGILAATLYGWSADRLAVFGIFVTVFAAIGGFLGGWIDGRLGSRNTILVGFVLVAIGAFGLIGAGDARIAFTPVAPTPGPLGYTLPEFGFVVSAMFVAIGSGPAIASMRALMAKIAPLDRMTSYFGLYSLVGKATFFLGPLSYAAASRALDDSQLALGVCFIFLAIGVVAFLNVREERIS
jgi:UMF1 family MFS transporter